jgi:DSF synthase
MSQLEIVREADAVWAWMRPQPRPCFTPALLAECEALHAGLRDAHNRKQLPVKRYLVLGSALPGVFNLGGDLALFAAAVRARDEAALLRYAVRAVQLVYRQWVGLRNLPLINIALVQGDALGGGFEAALAHNLLVAERGVRFGFPEQLFGLFPGMGAYQLLTRRLGPVQAERMILSGETVDAEHLYELGLVDVLAEPGEGERAVRDWMAKHRARPGPFDALLAMRRRRAPLEWSDMLATARLWVDTALALSARDLRRMERLVQVQQGKVMSAA